jgi:hypothetical protein
MRVHAAAVVVVLMLCPALVSAQAPKLTVNAPAATVHKSPSTGSPVIGRAQRGAQLEVTREVGDWVKVVWTYSSDGLPSEEGYVHLSMGVLGRHGADVAAPAIASVAGEPPPAVSPAPMRTSEANVQTRSLPPGRAGAVAEPASVYINRPTHVVGLGGQMHGATIGYGGTMRAWPMERLGVQFNLSRTSTTSASAPGSMTWTEVAPSALYSIADRVTDYVWFRPYVGSGVTFISEKLTGPDAVISNANTFGLRVFGGAELTMAAVPRLGVSADVGYRWAETSFTGFDTRGFGFSISAHWYVK